MTTTFNAAATKTVRVNGTNFVYREIGDKSGIPVVFLHHLTAVLEDWDPAIADGLAYFLSDPDRARAAGEQARASERSYNRDRFAGEWADTFSAGGHAIPTPAHVQHS